MTWEDSLIFATGTQKNFFSIHKFNHPYRHKHHIELAVTRYILAKTGVASLILKNLEKKM